MIETDFWGGGAVFPVWRFLNPPENEADEKRTKKMTQAVQMRVEAFSIAHIILAKCLVPAVNTNCRPAYLEGYSGFSCSAVPVISISAWDNITKCYTKKVMMWFFFCQWHCSTQIAVDFVFFLKSILRVHFPERFSFNICKSQHLRTVIIVFVLCLICLQTYCSRMCFKVSQNKWKLLDADVQLLCLLLLGFFRKLLHDLLRNVCSHFFLYISNLE